MKNSINTNDLILNKLFSSNIFNNEVEKYFSSYTANSFSSKIENHKDYILLSTKALGLSKEEIDIDITNDFLTIKSNDSKKDMSSLTSKINEKFKISNVVDKKNLTAKLEKGILEVKLPFKKSYNKSFKVNID
tara:strand:- start:44 stop:442 length:399 start_codon:yes stop_codon:yes gene_type:complete